MFEAKTIPFEDCPVVYATIAPHSHTDDGFGLSFFQDWILPSPAGFGFDSQEKISPSSLDH